MTIIADAPSIFATDADGLPLVQTRAAAVEAVDVESGIVECKIAPYEVEAQIGENDYEVFTRGAFAAAVGNPSRYKMSNQGHDFNNKIGTATMLRDEYDGLYGTIRISRNFYGNNVLILLRDKVLEHISIEFRPQKKRWHRIPRDGNTLWRHDQATLVGLSAVAQGAYGDDARVLSVREAIVDQQQEQEREKERYLARERYVAQLNSLTAGPKTP